MKLIDRDIVLDVLKRLATDLCNGKEVTAIDVLSEVNDVVLDASYVEDLTSPRE